MEITPLSSIKAFRYNYRIRVRICRTWRAIKIGAEKYSGLHCVMIDQHGASIHGFMPEDQVEDMNEKTHPGSNVGHSSVLYKTALLWSTGRRKHRDYPVIIHFNGHTDFCKVSETVPPIPAHSFRLVQFAQLDKEWEAQSVPSSQAMLTDVYGCIKSIRPPHPQYIRSQNKTGVKCEIVLENQGRESLTIVFWGKLARDFNVDAIMSLPSPVLAVFMG